MLDRCRPDPEVMREHRKGKKTAAICGFANSNRAYIPFDDPEVDIITINELGKQPWVKRWTMHVQLHSRNNWNRLNNHNDPHHPEWMKQDHGKPIYMQKEWPDVPNSVRFPLEEYINVFGRYATSTAAMMLGLMYLLGYERIEIYGIELASDTEYGHQRPCFEYVLGVLHGKGIEVWVDPASALLQGPLYGYQDTSIGFRTQIEMRRNLAKKEMQKAEDTAIRTAGKIELLHEFMQQNPNNPNLEKLMSDLQGKLDHANAEIATWSGAMQECGVLSKIYDAFPFEQEMPDTALLESHEPLEITNG